MGSNRMLIKALGIVFLLTFLAPVAFTQSVGHGISKHTWAASNPRQCYDWFYDFIPVREDFGSCPDGNCECATQGRVALDGYTGHTDITRPGPTGFGVHTINCTHHPYGELSLVDVENIFEEKFGDMSALDGFMDFNLGLWTNDLSTYVRKFQNKGQDFLTLSWSTHAGEEYYSVLVRPCGFVVLELISDTMDSELRSLAKPSNQRMFWKHWNNEHIAHGEYLTPIKISRAVSSVDKVKEFYIDILGSTEVWDHEFEDGVKLKIVNAPQSTIHLQFWEGVSTGGNGWTPEDLEIYWNNVHDDIIPKLEKAGVHYHNWGGSTGGGFDKLITVYAADPFGWGVQLDMPYYNPPPPTDLPFYSTYCESNDGCEGQGFC